MTRDPKPTEAETFAGLFGKPAERPATSVPEITASENVRKRCDGPKPATVRKREDKAERSAFYAVGDNIVRVRIIAWSADHDALVLPRKGGRLLLAAEGPGFLGLWVMPRQPEFGGTDAAIKAAEKQWRADTIDRVFARFGIKRKPRATCQRVDFMPEPESKP